jgi:type VI secretion system protein ImpK
MKLATLCEPLFQYVCMLNRIARNPSGEGMQVEPLREAIQGIFAGLKEKADADSRLAPQYSKVEQALVFFVDSMISESKLSVAGEWNKNRLAYAAGELAGDEKFFDLLDQTLEQSGPEADERLEIFYTCLGLGFTGWYEGQPEYLRKKMITVAKRIGAAAEHDQAAKLTPEAYDHADTRDLVQPPGIRLATLGIVFAVLLLVVFVSNFYLFQSASRHLITSLQEILSHDLNKR